MLIVILVTLVLPAKSLPKAPQRLGKVSPRKLWLWIASYGFCALVEWRSAILLLISTIVNWFAARRLGTERLQGSERPTRRRWLLWTALTLNIGSLALFKYYLFVQRSANAVLSRWGLGLPALSLMLPVGISFYSFQAVSYVVDVYRGKLAPITNLVDVGLYLAFFPKLIAGPLIRGADFFPQLKRQTRIKASDVWAGSQTFIIGLFKKTMVADAVSPFVDAVFGSPEYYSSGTVWLAVVAYALQIYCDFSGYSDMAIGSARILGFRLGRNFATPYLARDIQDFWRRWHITLSNWLRDYLYIPLGGSRAGTVRTYANLMITMILGGLWHGASWNFALWGGVHGLALVVHRLWSGWFPRTSPDGEQGRTWGKRAASILSTVVTLLFVTLAWVLFRAPTFPIAQAIYRKLLFIGSAGAVWTYHAALTAVGWTIGIHVVDRLYTSQERVPFKTPYSLLAALIVMLTLLIIYVFAPTEAGPFIYVQF
jgi:alginate O-acetyltransferase complex protein AlgI